MGRGSQMGSVMQPNRTQETHFSSSPTPWGAVQQLVQQLGRIPRPILGAKGPRNQVTVVTRDLPAAAAPSSLAGAGSSRHSRHSPPTCVTYSY